MRLFLFLFIAAVAQADQASEISPAVSDGAPFDFHPSIMNMADDPILIFYLDIIKDIIKDLVAAAAHPLLAPYHRVLSHYLNFSSILWETHWGEDVMVNCVPKRCWFFDTIIPSVPGMIFQVGRELEAVIVSAEEPSVEHPRYYYTTEVTPAIAKPFEWNLSMLGFLVDTGATTSKLRVEDIEHVPTSTHTSLGVVLPVYPTFLRTMIPVRRIGGHTFSPPILTSALVPLQPPYSTTRRIGVDFMLRFAQVNFECGSVEFFPFRVPDPSENALSSERVALRNLTHGMETTIRGANGAPTQFFVKLQYRGVEQSFRIDTGSDSTYVPPLPEAEPSHVWTPQGSETRIRLYPLHIDILGRTFSTRSGRFNVYNGASHVLGSDILSQLDVRFVRDENSAQIHIWDRCKKRNEL